MKKVKSRNVRVLKKKILKWGIFFVLIFVFLSQIGNVSAGMNDSVIEKNRMDGVYAVTTLNGQQRIFYLNLYRMNGRVAYCIEMGVDITTDIYHSTGDFSGSYLSSEQIEYIRSIGYFGYQYLGHDDYRYYMAAQEIIWEYLGNINVEWTNVLDVNGTRINIDSYKKEILELKRRYYNQVSFDWIDGQEYLGGEKLVLQDMVGVLSDYEVISSGHSKVSIDGNTLNIEVANGYVGMEEVVLRKKNYYDYDSRLYYYDSSQKLISSGNYKEMVKKLNFSIVGKTMNVQLIDKNNNSNVPRGQATLKGAIYELYNEKRELVGTYESNQMGSFVVNNLPYGIYYFKQIKASEGYLFNNKEVQVNFSNGNEKVRLLQEVITNTIEIKKVYGSNDVYEPEAGIYFEVIDWRGRIYSKVGTNGNGITVINLPYGTYTIVQVNTSWGYSIIDPFEVKVKEWKANNVYYNLINDLIQYKVRVNTIDMDSGKQFLDSGFVYRVREMDKDIYIDFNGNDEFVTDNEESLILPMLLPYGDYVLEQVDVPKGIVINNDVLEFSINEETLISKEGDEMFVDINFYNQLVMGRLDVFAKKEIFYSNTNEFSYKEEPRRDAKFLLVANKDIVINKEIIYHMGEEIQDVITDETGFVSVGNLYMGEYCLIDLDTEKKECFSLESVSNEEKVVIKELEIIDLLDKSQIKIMNKDELNQSIEGSVFEIYEEDGNLIYTGITNEDGFVQINDLVHGRYCISQSSVSVGWKLITDKQCIDLDENKNIDFINKKQESNKIAIPDTLSNISSWLLLSHVIVLIGMVIVVYKKIFTHY